MDDHAHGHVHAHDEAAHLDLDVDRPAVDRTMEEARALAAFRENGPAANQERVAELIRELLFHLGRDPDNDPGIADTPKRVAKFWRQFLDYEPGKITTAFAKGADVDQMVVVSCRDLWSLCEHHLLPFKFDVHIAYIARKNVLGLSKLGRIAKMHSRQLQLQERVVQGIAAEVQKMADTPDVAVMAEGLHTCMAMRGIEMDHTMRSTSIHGIFGSGDARREFYSLIQRSSSSY